jgi:hypothetical protein
MLSSLFVGHSLKARVPDAKVRDNGFVKDSSRCTAECSVTRRVEAVTWKASAYRLKGGEVRAVEDARWDRYEPFASYRPATGGQDPPAGPHIAFMGLKESMPDLIEFHRGLYSFANEYGLLGLFWDDHPTGPILPFGKKFVAPEALVDGRGRLRLLDPASEGKELLFKLQDRKAKEYGLEGHYKGVLDSYKAAGSDPVALPSELVVFPKIYQNLPPDGSDYRPVPWDQAKQKYGALLVADGRTYTGVSVLYRSEPLSLWELCLKVFPFPSGEPGLSESSDEYLLVSLTMAFEGGAVFPYPVVGEDGQLEQGWWCRDALSALYLMVYLDKTGDTTYRRCEAPGCGRLFRTGPNSTRVYCPHPEDPKKPSLCGSRVTSQRHRERQRRKS